MIGVTDTADFITSTSIALGPKFWDLFVFDDTLGAILIPSGMEVRQISLPNSCRGLRYSLCHWLLALARCGLFTRLGKLATLRRLLTDIPGTGNIDAYFSAPKGFSLLNVPVFLFTLEGLIGSSSGFFSAVVYWLERLQLSTCPRVSFWQASARALPHV